VENLHRPFEFTAWAANARAQRTYALAGPLTRFRLRADGADEARPRLPTQSGSVDLSLGCRS